MEDQFMESKAVNRESDAESRAAAVAEAKKTLARVHGLDCELVRIGPLAKILGLSSATIYGAIRQGRFFLPHRMLCSSPAVMLDDLAVWWVGESPEWKEKPTEPKIAAESVSTRVSKSAERNAIVEEALKEMERQSRKA